MPRQLLDTWEVVTWDKDTVFSIDSWEGQWGCVEVTALTFIYRVLADNFFEAQVRRWISTVMGKWWFIKWVTKEGQEYSLCCIYQEEQHQVTSVEHSHPDKEWSQLLRPIQVGERETGEEKTADKGVSSPFSGDDQVQNHQKCVLTNEVEPDLCDRLSHRNRGTQDGEDFWKLCEILWFLLWNIWCLLTFNLWQVSGFCGSG